MQKKRFFRFIQGIKDCNLTHSNYMNIHDFVFPPDLLQIFVSEKAWILFTLEEACWN